MNEVRKINAETQDHIDTVRKLIRIFANELLKRGELHDASKHSDEEALIFEEYGPKLKTCTYGSDEYKAYCKEMDVAIGHHYKNNSHHPEHHKNGVDGMTLLDIVEMFLDWVAASRRHADGDIRQSIIINRSRFKLSEQLVSILDNTAFLVKHSCLSDADERD